MTRATAGISAIVLVLALSVPGERSLAGQERLGTIDFPTSGSTAAQLHFLRGVLLLYSFEYDSAAAAFREAQRIDPDFALAYWGEAMTYTHPLWKQQDRDAGRTALAGLAATPSERGAKAPTDRERGWLAAVELLYGGGPKARRDTLYSRAMERLAQSYPEDLEAKAFYALSLLGLNQGDRDFGSYMRAAAIALDVFGENPDHPGAAHYIIHSFDDPIHAPLGLPAARAYSTIAPGAAHAQHMTSHIFLAMGMWDDVVAANEVAFEVSGRRSGHYTSWLQYGYLQQGRYEDALRFLQLIVRHTSKDPSPHHRGYLAAMRARQMLETRDWDGPAAAIEVDTTGLPWAAAQVDFADGVAAVARGETSVAQRALASMAARREQQAASGATGGVLGHAEVLERGLRALLWAESGRLEEAIAEAERAAELEASLPFEFGPPRVHRPPRELLGEILLRHDRSTEALRQFELALARTPLRARALLGLARAAALAGETEKAVDAYATLERLWREADPGPPEHAEAEKYLGRQRSRGSR